jgi:hypothetical protein
MGFGNYTNYGRNMQVEHTSMKDLFGDRRCSEAIIQFLRSTEIGRRFRERGFEEDDPGG